MPNFNSVRLIGHLTRDCVTRAIGADKRVTKTGLAVNGWKEGDVMFIDLTAWGKTGDALAKVKKGQPVGIRGRLALETWDDKASGAKRSKHSVTVYEVIYMGGGKATDTNEPDSPPAEQKSEEIPF